MKDRAYAQAHTLARYSTPYENLNNILEIERDWAVRSHISILLICFQFASTKFHFTTHFFVSHQISIYLSKNSLKKYHEKWPKNFQQLQKAQKSLEWIVQKSKFLDPSINNAFNSSFQQKIKVVLDFCIKLKKIYFLWIRFWKTWPYTDNR